MISFYIINLLLLCIATTNLIRANKENDSRSRTLGITINSIAIILITLACIIKIVTDGLPIFSML